MIDTPRTHGTMIQCRVGKWVGWGWERFVRKSGLTAWRVPLIGAYYIDCFWAFFYQDLTVRPKPEIVASKGNHPKMAELFRLVNFYNLPRLFACCKWGYILAS
jgi:hypothetical protein